jgi:hypothetical protein
VGGGRLTITSIPKWFVVLTFLGLALPARGQSNYAAVTGTVTDPQHLPVANATVELRALSTGAIRRVATNNKGIFEASALFPDDYEVTTSAAGFAAAKQSLQRPKWMSSAPPMRAWAK